MASSSNTIEYYYNPSPLKTWAAGDVITTERWEELNNHAPVAKYFPWRDKSNGIFDIIYEEAVSLVGRCFCWFLDDDGYVNKIRLSNLDNANGYAAYDSGDSMIT